MRRARRGRGEYMRLKGGGVGRSLSGGARGDVGLLVGASVQQRDTKLGGKG